MPSNSWRQARDFKRARRDFKGRSPLETMFSTMMTCQRLTGDRWRRDLGEYPEKASSALNVVRRIMSKFTRPAIDYGASGIFLSITPTHSAEIA